VALRGEVVQIFERDGERLVKLVVREPSVADLVVAMPEDVHLGDQVAIEARIVLNAISRLEDCRGSEANAPRRTGGSDE